ncbi:hypothetical protein FVB32_05275 [Flagellimonas hymeniacidonis]|uniref:HTH cro/C1-type domain-containing protein n=2 Tax=Flagellimonas hymeniacidonis TaxID=2603628 RepID=A0A5C8V935_9FLAO|nr:hypothetical protein FVB32_05275 [Flagellimonas hymeniacidonis]
MSEHLNLTQSTISKIENGTTLGNGFVKYLKFLVKHNLDINDYFRDHEK